MSLLTEEYFEEYDNDGVVVIENAIDDDQVDILRSQLHAELLKHGIDHDKILSGEQTPPYGPLLKCPAANFYYGKWKIDAQINERIYSTTKDLMNRTYSSGVTKGYEHPYGKSTNVVPYIDRVCWRIPDVIRHEGGLGLHLDRNPFDPYLLDKTKGGAGLHRWRPIQMFLTLTDHYGSESGGLKVIKGFHKKIDEYFASNDERSTHPSAGEFYRMNSKKYTSLEKELQPINAKKGSLVCWDNRLPHATCEFLSGFDTREVIYMSYLPNVDINIKHHSELIKNISKNIFPPMYMNTSREKCDRDWDYDELTSFQKSMLMK